jgi:superoxide dismutase, Fe-Mn family
MMGMDLGKTPAAPISRRRALTALGAGLAWLGTAASRAQPAPEAGTGLTPLGDASAAPSAPAAPAPAAVARPLETLQPFTLPKLPYAYEALAPHMDARTMELHHSKHHLAYINAANTALAARPDLRDLSGEALLARLDIFDEPLRSTLRNHVGGHLNHAVFWGLLAPARSADLPYGAGALRAALVTQWGSLEAFQADFAKVAQARFGSGWAWLVWAEGRLLVTSTANQDSPLMAGQRPLIGLDVWEHAYYLQYQNRRVDFVTAFWQVLNWDVAEAHYAAVVSTAVS